MTLAWGSGLRWMTSWLSGYEARAVGLGDERVRTRVGGAGGQAGP